MIRQAREGDCLSLAALSLEVWLATYAVEGIDPAHARYALSAFTEQKFKAMLSEPKYGLLVEAEGEYVRGYVLLNLESTWNGGSYGFEVDKLYVHSPYQHQGIGKALLSAVENTFGKQFWLHTWIHNKSLGFYQKYGFQEIGRCEVSFEGGVIENRVLGYART